MDNSLAPGIVCEHLWQQTWVLHPFPCRVVDGSATERTERQLLRHRFDSDQGHSGRQKFAETVPSVPVLRMLRPRITYSLVTRRAFSARARQLLPSRILLRQSLSLPTSTKIVSCGRVQQIRQKTIEVKLPEWVKPGDWICGNCQAHNYRLRVLCYSCQSPNTEGRTFYKKGDWFCPTCQTAVTRQQPAPTRFLIL